jgi:D-amino peptidase
MDEFMKIFIMTDLEGISGISRKEQVDNSEPYALERLMADVNAAIRGAFDGGADEVYVEDGHGGGRNFLKELLDPRAVQVGNAGTGVTDMTKADAMFLIGAHAMSGTLNAFLDHTQSSMTWHDYYVNGRRCGEIAQEAIYAGAFGVPVVMVSGDMTACTEARQFLGNIRTAVVKYAVCRNEAECIPDDEAERLIYEAAKAAMGRIGEAKPYKITLPAEIKIEYNRADYCDDAAKWSGAERLDARTLRKVVDKIEFYRDILI